MTAFVILAAGKGTRIGRVGETLHKSLVPLNGKAIISHQVALAPHGSRTIIAVGHRSDQIREYMMHAHPKLNVTYVNVLNYDLPGGGPGASLLACREAVGDDHMIFTSCDTLWEDGDIDWNYTCSWSAVAPVPSGTPPFRWCRIATNDFSTKVDLILDKTPTDAPNAMAYVGLSMILGRDLQSFWTGLAESHSIAGEVQVSGGLSALVYEKKLTTQRIDWTDVGDEASYAAAVARHSGFDWVKAGQATYVLPNAGRVVKFHKDPMVISQRWQRAHKLRDIVPPSIQLRSSSAFTANFLSYEYVPGMSAYEAAETFGTVTTEEILGWFHEKIMSTLISDAPSEYWRELGMMFYRDKTFERVMMLPPELRSRALDVVTRVDWRALMNDMLVGRWHGDLNFGNIIVPTPPKTGQFVGIDWREDFVGDIEYGDLRYDLAKLLAGTVVHWDNARRGDFRPWSEGEAHAKVIRDYATNVMYLRDIEIIGALTLLNSAPLHAAPLDGVLVARGVSWLETVL